MNFLIKKLIKTNISSYFSIALLSVGLTACGGGQSSDQQSTESPQAQTPVVDSTPISLNQNIVSRTAADLAPYLTRNIQDEVFYFVMPDRFSNGDTDNDQGSKTLAISAGGFDKTDKGMYHGGDIKGLENKLPYLKELGISAIWLTPILRNQAMQADGAGYHGYWVLDFTEIDPHLGTNEDMKAFIDAAHKENIKVFFDIITNHTADVIKFTECHGADGLQWLVQGSNGCPYKSLAQLAAGDKYTVVVPKGQENIKVPAWLNNVNYYHNQGDSTFEGENSVYGDFAGLDDVDTNNPEVVRLMTDTFKDLISDFKPDGFRIDTVKHVNVEFWAEFAPALVKHAQEIGIPEFFMFGEVYSFDSKELSTFTTTGKMQSILDFAFQGTVYDAVINQKGTDVIDRWLANDSFYLDEDSNANQLLNFTGNHDMGRFAHSLAKSAFNYNEQQQIDRNLLASAMMYFMRGIPIVYYGDEQGFVGDGGDKDSRQDMMPSFVDSYNDDDLIATDATTAADNFDQQHLFYTQLAEFADVYYQYPALRHGQQSSLYHQTTAGIYALARTSDKHDDVIVVFNTANTAKTASFDVNNTDLQVVYQAINSGVSAAVQGSTLTVNLPPLSLAILSTAN